MVKTGNGTLIAVLYSGQCPPKLGGHGHSGTCPGFLSAQMSHITIVNWDTSAISKHSPG